MERGREGRKWEGREGREEREGSEEETGSIMGSMVHELRKYVREEDGGSNNCAKVA